MFEGPFDSGDPVLEGLEEPPGCVDFGSLRIPMPAGAQLQVESGSGELLRAVHVLVPAGRVSLSALAAPRSSPLWRGLAGEIADSLAGEGARVRTEWGQWGREVEAGSGGALSRFIGVDGPRWMLYGVATGPADGAAELAETLRAMMGGTVVRRGVEPLPVKTVLPLRLPEHLEERMALALEAAAQQEVTQQDAPPPPRRPVPPCRSSSPPVMRTSPPSAGQPANQRPAAAGPCRLPAPEPRSELRPESPRRGQDSTRRKWEQDTLPHGYLARASSAEATGELPRVSQEESWSSAKPAVGADQMGHQPAWALLEQALTFWPDERFASAPDVVPLPPDRGALDVPLPPDRGALDDARPARPEPLTDLFAPAATADDAAGESAGEAWPRTETDRLNGTEALHLALINDSAATRDWRANADRRGRHRRSG